MPKSRNTGQIRGIIKNEKVKSLNKKKNFSSVSAGGILRDL
jgi:hypothetical protein